MPELLVEVLDVKELELKMPVYVSLQVGATRLRANVKNQGEVAEAFRFTYRKLEELYKETLTYTVTRKDNDQAVARGSIPISRLKIGKKVDRHFDTVSQAPELQKPPLVRLALELTGPLRPEFNMINSIVQKYANSVDGTIDSVQNAGAAVQPYVWNKWALPLLIPLSGVFIASIPVLALAVTVGLPLLLPLVLLGVVAGLTMVLAAGVLAISSRASRAKLQAALNPVVTKLTTTPVGQELLYETGPRPSPFRVVKALAPSDVWGKLVASLIIDFVGASSYALPGLGEFADLAWAPTQAVLMAAMYSESSPYAAYFGLLEEILPFTDIIPSATLAWLKEYGSTMLREVHTRTTPMQNGMPTAQSYPR